MKFLKPSPRYFLALALFCGALLGAPHSWLRALGLTEIVDENRSWLGVALVLSTCLLLAFAAAEAQAPVRRWLRTQAIMRRGRARLRDLTPREQEILRAYLKSNSRTQLLACNDGAVVALERAYILHRASNIAEMFETFHYNIQPWAWRHLRRKPRLVGLEK